MDFSQKNIEEEFKIITLISCDGDELCIPLYFLKKRSSYFKSISEGNFIESRSGVIKTEYSKESLEDYLRYNMGDDKDFFGIELAEMADYFGDDTLRDNIFYKSNTNDKISILKFVKKDEYFDNLLTNTTLDVLTEKEDFSEFFPMGSSYEKYKTPLFYKGYIKDSKSGVLRKIIDDDKIVVKKDDEHIIFQIEDFSFKLCFQIYTHFILHNQCYDHDDEKYKLNEKIIALKYYIVLYLINEMTSLEKIKFIESLKWTTRISLGKNFFLTRCVASEFELVFLDQDGKMYSDHFTLLINFGPN